MKNSFLYKLAIVASLSIAVVSCKSTAPTASSPNSASTPETTSSASSTPTETKTEKLPDTIRVSVINNSGKVLTAIYISPPNKKEWGRNELDASIPDREKSDFEWKRADYKGSEAGCLFEVRTEYADGKNTELDAIDLCKTPTINLN